MATTKTTVADTIYDSQLVGQSGTVTITPDSHWITVEGESISPVPVVATLSTGAFSVSLVPTDALATEGHYYTVVYTIGSAAVRRTTRWSVPSGGPCTIQDVEVAPGAGVVYASAASIYMGAITTDGSWRFVRSGNNVCVDRRESGSWVTKMTITA